MWFYLSFVTVTSALVLFGAIALVVVCCGWYCTIGAVIATIPPFPFFAKHGIWNLEFFSEEWPCVTSQSRQMPHSLSTCSPFSLHQHHRMVLDSADSFLSFAPPSTLFVGIIIKQSTAQVNSMATWSRSSFSSPVSVESSPPSKEPSPKAIIFRDINLARPALCARNLTRWTTATFKRTKQAVPPFLSSKTSPLLVSKERLLFFFTPQLNNHPKNTLSFSSRWQEPTKRTWRILKQPYWDTKGAWRRTGKAGLFPATAEEVRENSNRPFSVGDWRTPQQCDKRIVQAIYSGCNQDVA